MTDNRTTELLRKLLDERGVKYSDFTSATRNGKAIFKTRWKHERGYAELSEWESTGSNNLFIQNVDPEQVIAATLWSDDAFTREEVESAFVRGYSLGSLPVGSDPQWDENRQTVDEHMAELGWVRAAKLGSEPTYDELIRCLENDWNISASWDGLRKFWCIELTEEGVKLRDAVRGTLTAEQVREAVKRCATFDYGEVGEYVSRENWQAIADELNARAERTCRNTHENRWFKCSACGYGFTDLYAEDESDIDEQPRYCPNCGARVVA